MKQRLLVFSTMLLVIFSGLSCTEEAPQTQEKKTETAAVVDNTVKKTIEKTSKENITESGYEQIQWINLLPEKDLQALTEAPIPDTIIEGSAADKINSPLSITINDPVTEFERALVSSDVKKEFNKRKIKLPGYIVPLETSEDGRTTSFFLVPFFGACLHLPPPPPNQIIYATHAKGIKMDDLDIPFWLEGTVYTKKKMNDMALAAYSMHVDKFYEFKDTDEY